MLPKELMDKIMMPKVAAEVDMDTPELPRKEIIITMEMPKNGEEPEKPWAHRKDSICYTDDCLLYTCCVSDDGKAWFLKSFDNISSADDSDRMEAIHKALQSAKGCCPENHHYGLGECDDLDKIKDDEDLQKMMPEGKLEGKNKFKDYEVPVNPEDFDKCMKKYCTYKFENPSDCGKKSNAGY